MFVCPRVNYLLAFSVCDVRFRSLRSSNVCTQHSLPRPFFLVSLLYFSIPSHVTLGHPPRTLFRRYAHTLPHGFWEMEGLSRCVCYLVVNTLLSRVGCPFQRLIKSSGNGGPRDRSVYVDNGLCHTVWTRVFSHLLEISNGEGERVGG